MKTLVPENAVQSSRLNIGELGAYLVARYARLTVSFSVKTLLYTVRLDGHIKRGPFLEETIIAVLRGAMA